MAAVTFSEQVGLFVLVAEKANFCAVCLREHEVADRLKTCSPPCVEEDINLRPAIEHHGQTIVLKDAICPGANAVDAYSIPRDFFGEADGECLNSTLRSGVVDIFVRTAEHGRCR